MPMKVVTMLSLNETGRSMLFNSCFIPEHVAVYGMLKCFTWHKPWWAYLHLCLISCNDLVVCNWMFQGAAASLPVLAMLSQPCLATHTPITVTASCDVSCIRPSLRQQRPCTGKCPTSCLELRAKHYMAWSLCRLFNAPAVCPQG